MKAERISCSIAIGVMFPDDSGSAMASRHSPGGPSRQRWRWPICPLVTNGYVRSDGSPESRWGRLRGMPNRLAGESSPYLLQHQNNPVDWYPWGEEALARAKAEDKPLFVSIGYAACHWCHVMEHESFENPEIAALMNSL